MKMRKNQYRARNLYVKKWLNQSRKCINRKMGNANSPSNSFLEKMPMRVCFCAPKIEGRFSSAGTQLEQIYNIMEIMYRVSKKSS